MSSSTIELKWSFGVRSAQMRQLFLAVGFLKASLHASIAVLPEECLAFICYVSSFPLKELHLHVMSVDAMNALVGIARCQRKRREEKNKSKHTFSVHFSELQKCTKTALITLEFAKKSRIRTVNSLICEVST